MNGQLKLSCDVTYKKKPGKLTLFEKVLVFNSSQFPNLNLEIILDKVTIVQKSENPKKKTCLILVTTKECSEGYIFSFNYDKSNIRDVLYDYLYRGERKEPEENKFNIQDAFISLNSLKKRHIYLLMTDKYVQLLFDELSDILSKEEFMDFLRNKYKHKVDTISQKINLSRSDELILSENNYEGKNYCIFDYRLLQKFRKYDEDINLLYESMRKGENVKKFWDEFIDNQKKNQTELIGELNPPYFTQDQINRINEIKKKLNLIDKYKRIPNEINSKMGLNQIQYFKNNYFGTPLNVKEFDIEEENLNKLTNGRIELMKESTTKLISSLNNYSLRKLKNMEPMQSFYNIKKDENILNQDCNMLIDKMAIMNNQNVPNEEKVNDMIKEFELNKNSNLVNNKQKFELNKQIFLELNERIRDHIKNCSPFNVTNIVDLEAIEFLKTEHNILKDLKDLHNFILKKFSHDVALRKINLLVNAYNKSIKRLSEFIDSYKNSNMENLKGIQHGKEIKDKLLDALTNLIDYYDLLKKETK